MVKKTRKSLIHLKSSVSGKIPTAEQLNYGEIAINYAKDSEAIFFKNSENNVVEVKTNSAVVEELNTKQDKTDNALATTAKTVTGAINEINTKVSNIPTVNNPKVSIKMNGTEKGSFTLNQASAGEVDLGTVITAHQDISGKVDKTLNAKAFEGITIQTSNIAEAMSANKAAIQAYVNNLNMLGVDTTKGFNVPVRIDDDIDDDFYGCLTGEYHTGRGYFLSGTIFSIAWGAYYIKAIFITPAGQYMELVNIKNDNGLSTTSKNLIGAINEVNNLAKSKGNGTITGVKMNGVSKGTSGVVDLGTVLTAHQDISGKVDKALNAKAFEAITIQTTNSAADKAANVAAIKAYVNNLKTLGVDTTKILSIPVKMGIDSIGNLMYRDIGNYFSLTGMVFGFNDMEINYVYIDNDGGYSKFLGVYDEDGLETVRKNIVGAINEVNTLAKNKQDKLTSGTNIKTINNQSLLGSGDITIKSESDVVKCRINITSQTKNENNSIFYKLPLADVLKYKEKCDIVEIYGELENGSIEVQFELFRTYTGYFCSPLMPGGGDGMAFGMFNGDSSTTNENEIGFNFISFSFADVPLESNNGSLIASGTVYRALQAKQDKLTSGTNIKTINNQSILGRGNVDISAPIYVVPMIMSTDGYPIPDSSKIDTNKLSIYMKSGYTVIGKPVDSSAPIVSFITGNNGYHYHYFDEKKGMMVIRVYGNNLSQHEIEYNYQFAAPQDSGSTGVCGGVPVPTYDDKEKMLKGDGTWSEVKTIDGESLIGSGDIKIKNNDYYLPVSAFSGQTAVTQDVLDTIVDVRNSQGRKHLYIYDENTTVGAVAEASVANWSGTFRYFVSWMAYYGSGYNTIWAYQINSSSKKITESSFNCASFRGATTSASGRQGMVPAPTTADTESFLCGNGEWKKISGGSSAPSITIDTSMSDTSTNPVQNKVIKAYIDGLVGNVAAQLAQI